MSPPPGDELQQQISADDQMTQQIVDLLSSMPNFTPIIPEELIEHYLAKTGIPPHQMDSNSKKLISLMAEKFMTDVTTDALAYARLKTPNTSIYSFYTHSNLCV